jgi:hypothetical protein
MAEDKNQISKKILALFGKEISIDEASNLFTQFPPEEIVKLHEQLAFLNTLNAEHVKDMPALHGSMQRYQKEFFEQVHYVQINTLDISVTCLEANNADQIAFKCGHISTENEGNLQKSTSPITVCFLDRNKKPLSMHNFKSIYIGSKKIHGGIAANHFDDILVLTK